MKSKYLNIIPFLILIILFHVSVSSAFQNSDEMDINDELIEVIERDQEILFPISVYKNSFSEKVSAKLTDAGRNSILRIITEYGQQDIDLFVNADQITEHIGRINFDDSYLKNFSISADVSVRDVYPHSSGGCYLGFTDYGMTKEADTAAILFIFNGQDGMIYVKNTGDTSGTKNLVGELPDKPQKFKLMHLMGYSLVFVNDVFVGQYYDGRSGPFRLSYGAAVFPDGDTAACSFDNLEIRKAGEE